MQQAGEDVLADLFQARERSVQAGAGWCSAVEGGKQAQWLPASDAPRREAC